MPYRFARNGTAYGDPKGFAATMSLVEQKAAQWGGRYRVKPSRRDDWSEPMGRPAMTMKVGRAMRRSAWGGLIKVSMGTNRPGGPAIFLIQKVQKEAPPAPEPLRMYTGAIVDLTKGNPRIAKAAQYAKDHCRRVQCSGWVYTRYVSGTTTWSQHSRFAEGGNAVDLTVYHNDDYHDGIDMDATQDVADVLVAAARAGALQLRRVIFRDAQWNAPSWQAISYGGTYHTHVHAEAAPLQTGTPVDAP